MQNAKKVIGAVAALGNVIDVVGRTSGLKSKLLQLGGLVVVLRELDGVSFKEAIKEAKEADGEQRQVLVQTFAVKFDIADKSLESKIEEGLDVAVDSSEAIMLAVDKAKNVTRFIGSLKGGEQVAVGTVAPAVEAPAEGVAQASTQG